MTSTRPPERNLRVVAVVAVLAVLGLLLAVLISSCVGPDATAGPPPTTAEAPVETTEPETVAETAPEAEAPEPEPAPEPAPELVVDVAAEAGTFGTLLGLLERSGLDSTLADGGPFTLLAPTDAAFDALPPEVLAALESDEDALRAVLAYHVVPEAVAPDALGTGALTTLEGASVEIGARGGRALEAANGWLYPIDHVLLPPDLDLAALVGDEAAAEAYDRADFVVFFAIGSADLDGDAQQTIAEAAAEIEALAPGSRVRLVGVADPTGDPAANLELSRERARAVRAALRQALPEADVRYVVRAMGEEDAPRLENARRVDIVLVAVP